MLDFARLVPPVLQLPEGLRHRCLQNLHRVGRCHVREDAQVVKARSRRVGLTLSRGDYQGRVTELCFFKHCVLELRRNLSWVESKTRYARKLGKPNIDISVSLLDKVLVALTFTIEGDIIELNTLL